METETRETNNNYYPEGMGPWGWGRQTPATGIVGTILGAIGTAGVVLGAMGLMNRNQNGGNGGCSEDKYVTRYELGLVQENNALRATVAKLESQIYTDAKFETVNTATQVAIAAQQRVNDAIMASVKTLAAQAETFSGLTQTILSPRAIAPAEAILASFKANGTATTSGSGAAAANNEAKKG